MPKYYCWRCQKVWSSGGIDDSVEPALCPTHSPECKVSKPLHIFKAPRLSDVAFTNPPQIFPKSGWFGQ